MSNESKRTISIPGLEVIQVHRHNDVRGSFVKPFDRRFLESKGISLSVAETFFSESHRDVLRGFHFQIPPYAHQKIVTCIRGRILDVFIDLRVGSPAFGVPESYELSGEQPTALVIPAGVAHAFYSYEDHSLMAYWIDTGYAPAQDVGIHWASVGFDWPTDHPIISSRDASLPEFKDFESPFTLQT